MKTRTKSVLFAVFFTALVAVSITPTAQAQDSPLSPACTSVADASISGTFAPLSFKRLKPITGFEPITVDFAYKSSGGSKSVTQVPVTFSYTVDKSWAQVSLDKTTAFAAVSDSAQEKSVELPVTVSVAFTQAAPAFEQVNIKVTATPGDGTCVKKAAPTTVEIPIKADFYERYQARFEKTIHKTGQNAQIQIPLTVENLGNAGIQIRFKINEKTSDKLNFAPPGPQIIQSTISGGENNKLTIPIDVQTPFKNGYENRRDQLILDIEGNAADESTIALTSLQLTAVIQTQGVYVPGFGAVSMLFALLGAIFMTRRFRE
ncbi:MAG: hypothetical protein KY455_00130 [Euryarchaeota archaeon]|nr:hypothetical protein [Euryarchaeota archaeon]